MDSYSDFSELRQNEKEGEDYVILCRETNSKIAVIAPHGGGIEPGTVDIADAVAGSEHTFYAFKGIKKTGNRILHINSNKYDEPEGLRISKHAHIVVSIHGCRGRKEMVLIGGKNRKLKQIFMFQLREAGFNAVVSEVCGLLGKNPKNICNRCKSGKGVQLEISRGLREKMFDNLSHRSSRKKTVVFYDFVSSLRSVLYFLGRNIRKENIN